MDSLPSSKCGKESLCTMRACTRGLDAERQYQPGEGRRRVRWGLEGSPWQRRSNVQRPCGGRGQPPLGDTDCAWSKAKGSRCGQNVGVWLRAAPKPIKRQDWWKGKFVYLYNWWGRVDFCPKPHSAPPLTTSDQDLLKGSFRGVEAERGGYMQKQQ